MNFCCKMRRHFLVGVVGARYDGPPPVEVGEFIEDFTAAQPTIVTRFCPFCGASLKGQTVSKTWTPNPPEVF